MLKVVLDTNTLVSATITQGKEFQLLRLGHEGKIKIFISPEILGEFAGVISREKFGFSKQQQEQAIKQVMTLAILIEPLTRINAIKEDPADNKILECAEAGKVDYIVSGDKHLLKLKEHLGIKITTSSDIFKKIGE